MYTQNDLSCISDRGTTTLPAECRSAKGRGRVTSVRTDVRGVRWEGRRTSAVTGLEVPRLSLSFVRL